MWAIHRKSYLRPLIYLYLPLIFEIQYMSVRHIVEAEACKWKRDNNITWNLLQGNVFVFSTLPYFLNFI